MTHRTKELIGALVLGASLIYLVWSFVYKVLKIFL